MTTVNKLEAALHEASVYGIGATSEVNQRIILQAAQDALNFVKSILDAPPIENGDES